MCRQLYVDARCGMNTTIFHRALQDLVRTLGAEGPSFFGALADLSAADSRSALDRAVELCRAVEALALRLKVTKLFRRQETLSVLGIALCLARLGVDEVVTGDIPLPPGGAVDVKNLLLRRYHGFQSPTSGISTTAALLFDVLDVRQTGEVRGLPLAVAQVKGSEGTPFSLILLESRAGEGSWETIVQLETNVDHITGEEAGLALQRLAEDKRVLDVLWLSGIGKKNRPAGVLRVLCRARDREHVRAALLRHTHTLGFREQELARFAVDRAEGVAGLSDGTGTRAKLYVVDGQWFARPESDAVRDRARETGEGAPALRFERVQRP